MKRLVSIFAVLTLLAAAAVPSEGKRFGIKGGVNVTSLDFNSGMPAAMGYQAGIAWQYDLPLWISLQPEILYHVKATNLSQIESQLSFGYVEVPVNIQWGPRLANKNIRVFAQASPFVGYAVSQSGLEEPAISDEMNDALESVVGVDVKDKWKGINRFSYGAGLGIGVQLWALQVTAQYNWNFGSLMSAEFEGKHLEDFFNDDHLSGATITVAVLFGGNKKNKKQ